MCVAAIIHKPVSEHYLRCMDEDNPHGAGVAWMTEAGELRFERGLDHTQIFAMQEHGMLTFPYLLHFRWATHGSKAPHLTHPFPTGWQAFDGELSGIADEVLIHNGVWYDYVQWEPLIRDVDPELLRDISDTAVAAYFYKWYPDIGDEIPWAVASGRIRGGQLDIVKHGGWSEHEGNEFSNLSWLPWNMQSVHRVSAENLDSRDWRDYVLGRYGAEVADEVVRLADNEDDAITMANLAALDELEVLQGGGGGWGGAGDEWEGGGDSGWPDLVSEDPQTVNAWLAKNTTSAYLSATKPLPERSYTSYVKCLGCEIFTRAEDAMCGYCKAALAKAEAADDSFQQKQNDPRGAA